MSDEAKGKSFAERMEEHGRKILTDALTEAGGNRKTAAELLQVNRTHMYVLMDRYHVKIAPAARVKKRKAHTYAVEDVLDQFVVLCRNHPEVFEEDELSDNTLAIYIRIATEEGHAEDAELFKSIRSMSKQDRDKLLSMAQLIVKSNAPAKKNTNGSADITW